MLMKNIGSIQVVHMFTCFVAWNHLGSSSAGGDIRMGSSPSSEGHFQPEQLTKLGLNFQSPTGPLMRFLANKVIAPPCCMIHSSDTGELYTFFLRGWSSNVAIWCGILCGHQASSINLSPARRLPLHIANTALALTSAWSCDVALPALHAHVVVSLAAGGLHRFHHIFALSKANHALSVFNGRKLCLYTGALHNHLIQLLDVFGVWNLLQCLHHLGKLLCAWFTSIRHHVAVALVEHCEQSHDSDSHTSTQDSTKGSMLRYSQQWVACTACPWKEVEDPSRECCGTYHHGCSHLWVFLHPVLPFSNFPGIPPAWGAQEFVSRLLAHRKQLGHLGVGLLHLLELTGSIHHWKMFQIIIPHLHLHILQLQCPPQSLVARKDPIQELELFLQGGEVLMMRLLLQVGFQTPHLLLQSDVGCIEGSELALEFRLGSWLGVSQHGLPKSANRCGEAGERPCWTDHCAIHREPTIAAHVCACVSCRHVWLSHYIASETCCKTDSKTDRLTDTRHDSSRPCSQLGSRTIASKKFSRSTVQIGTM